MRGFSSPSRGLLVAGEVGGWSPARVEAGRRRAASLDAACGWRLREGGDWELGGVAVAGRHSGRSKGAGAGYLGWAVSNWVETFPI